jgi:hypothetical protein
LFEPSEDDSPRRVSFARSKNGRQKTLKNSMEKDRRGLSAKAVDRASCE